MSGAAPAPQSARLAAFSSPLNYMQSSHYSSRAAAPNASSSTAQLIQSQSHSDADGNASDVSVSSAVVLPPTHAQPRPQSQVQSPQQPVRVLDAQPMLNTSPSVSQSPNRGAAAHIYNNNISHNDSANLSISRAHALSPAATPARRRTAAVATAAAAAAPAAAASQQQTHTRSLQTRPQTEPQTEVQTPVRASAEPTSAPTGCVLATPAPAPAPEAGRAKNAVNAADVDGDAEPPAPALAPAVVLPPCAMPPGAANFDVRSSPSHSQLQTQAQSLHAVSAASASATGSPLSASGGAGPVGSVSGVTGAAAMLMQRAISREASAVSLPPPAPVSMGAHGRAQHHSPQPSQSQFSQPQQLQQQLSSSQQPLFASLSPSHTPGLSAGSGA